MKAILTVLFLSTVAAVAHPHHYYQGPTYYYPPARVYNPPPVYYAPPPVYYSQPPVYYAQPNYCQPRYSYGYNVPSVSFGVGGGRSRVYFNVPLR